MKDVRARIEVREIEEHHLEAYAANVLDAPTREAVEAYLLHHPAARRRVDIYRREQLAPPRHAGS